VLFSRDYAKVHLKFVKVGLFWSNRNDYLMQMILILVCLIKMYISSKTW